MMRKELYWLDGPWPGKLAMAARPRGGDWLKDDIANWKRAGIDMVLSLLTPDEESEMDLRDEAGAARTQGMEFDSFPIPDRQIPRSEAKWSEVLEKVTRTLSDGKNVVVHCRQGIGRSGLLAACLLVRKGMSPGAAVDSVSAARGVSVPETAEQRDWIDHYAVSLAATK
jgi:protein-tyrosine phosphatase